MSNTLTLTDEFKNKYNIKEIVGTFKGAQKDVFIVELLDNKRVAIKIFRLFDKREKKEVETYTKYYQLPGIPKIIEISEYNNSVVLIEEYIEGQTLQDKIEQDYYKNNPEKIIPLLNELVNILDPVWRDGLIHRDLKPQNIIIKPDDKPIVIDFGIVKDLNDITITETGFQPNSWRFAAPEQIFAKKKQISYRTDFFSIGVISYYMYHQSYPFGQSKEDQQTLYIGDFLIQFDAGFPAKEFCKQACMVNPSQRPRNSELLLNFL